MTLLPASYLTLSGSEHKAHQPRYNALDRAKAAHAVGIPGIGILLGEELDPAILKYADVVECEWLDLSQRVTPADVENLRIAQDYGCSLVKTGLCDNQTTPQQARENLSTVIDAAGETGMTVAFEPVVWGNLPRLRDADPVISGETDWPEIVGICYDTWQIATGSWPEGLWYPTTDIAKVEVSGVKLAIPEDLETAAMDRPLLTESHINISTWVKDLLSRGFTGPVTYEQPVARWREQSLIETAEAAAADMATLNF